MIAFCISLLFHIAWMLPCVALLVFFVDRVARGAMPSAMHRLWMLVLPLVLALSVLTAILQHSDNGKSLIDFALSVGTPILMPLHTSSTALPLHISRSVAEFILIAITAWIFAALVRFTFQLIAVSRLRRVAVKQTLTPQQREQIEGIAAHMGISLPAVLQSAEIHSPILVGNRYPAILFPVDFATHCSIDEFASAIAHECAHIRRRDYLFNLILRSLATLLFWHPCSVLVLRQLSISREVATDRLAAETIGNPRTYAKSLLHLWQRITPSAVQPQGIGIFDADILEERIMQIVNHVPCLTRTRRILITSASLLASCGGAYAANLLHVQVQNPIVANATQGNSNVVSRVNPIPPANFHKQPIGFTAKVVLGVMVQQDGRPQNIRVVTSGGRDYDMSAIDAVRQWHFRSGNPYKTNVTINFLKTE